MHVYAQNDNVDDVNIKSNAIHASRVIRTYFTIQLRRHVCGAKWKKLQVSCLSTKFYLQYGWPTAPFGLWIEAFGRCKLPVPFGPKAIKNP